MKVAKQVNQTTEDTRGPFIQRQCSHCVEEENTPFISPSRVGRVQAKLTIGQPGDQYEREADQIADYVMRMSADGFHAPTIGHMHGIEPDLQCQCTKCTAEQTMVPDNEEHKADTNSYNTAPSLQLIAQRNATGILQTKPSVNKPGDEYEQEADRIAEQVMRIPVSQMQHGCSCGGECLKCQMSHSNQEHERLQTKCIQSNDTGQIAAPPSIHGVLSFPSQPLNLATLAFMEPRFGYDFSKVRIHTDTRAAESARAVNAKAYTIGRHVVFGAGQYQTDTPRGRALLAHELVHVIQQNGMDPSAGHPLGSLGRVSTAPSSIQRREFGESVRFDSLPGLPPRATILGPFLDSAIAEELYGDPTISIIFLSDFTIEIDYDQLLPRWRSYFDRPIAEETVERNSWPFPGFSAGDIRQYIDENITAVAVNLVSGQVFLTVEGSDQLVEAPIRWFTNDDLDVLPIVPPRSSREEAVAEQPQYEFFREQHGLTPVLFYRDSNGSIWPIIVNPQTAPRIMSVYPRAFEAARQDVGATRDAFIDLAWWYVGARFSGRVRTSSGPQTGRLIISRGATLSSQEMAIAQRLVNEGRTVRVLTESTRQGVRTADFVVDGIRTELKTISNLTSMDISGALGRRILEGAGQAPHIIADVRGQANITRELAQRAIRRAFGADKLRRIQQIRIIGRDFEITVPRLP